MSRIDRRSVLLLTGASGLLGRYLLKDLSAQGRNIAVLVRGRNYQTAKARIDSLLRDWDDISSLNPHRPFILHGDITKSECGLSASDLNWISANVNEVVHSAASLAFLYRDKDGEPYSSNVLGTSKLLEVCRSTGIRNFHHISTAYVCGLRSGKVLETELDVGQSLGNDYERSKIESEQLVKASSFFESATIYRPSIIIGDLSNGFTSTFHGFYAPLRILHAWVDSFLNSQLQPKSLLASIGMTGMEYKNLVPVNWVSAVISRIVLNPKLHNNTYHITSSRPTSVSSIESVFSELLSEMHPCDGQSSSRSSFKPVIDSAKLTSLFYDQMEIYKSYWRNDPEFDSTNTSKAVPDLPSPLINEAVLRRLCRFAIHNNYKWPPAFNHLN